MSSIMHIFIQVTVLLISIILHEISHGYVAYLCGDRTAKHLGRLTLNPIKHVDLFGSIIIPLMLKLSGSGFIFGYAKPVPVNPNNFKNEKSGSFFVSIAGPLTNVILAICCTFLLKTLLHFDNNPNSIIVQFLIFGVMINCVLSIFNMIPILPLDGGRVLCSILPEKIAYNFYKTEKFGMLIVLFVGVFGSSLQQMTGLPLDFIGNVFAPLCNFVYTSLLSFAISF